MNIKSILFVSCFLVSTWLTSCNTEKKPLITISNKSDLSRSELISIPYDQFSASFGSDTVFKLQNTKTGDELSYQFEKLGTSSIQNILVWIELTQQEEIQLSVIQGEKATPVAPRTFARYVPERKDDFAWENDKIAFRAYGAALENFPTEMAFGIDVWAKRTSKLIINDWYRVDDYHTDHGEGLDYYSVGLTLGGGGIAPYHEGQIIYPKNYRQYETLDNGPLRSSFKLIYEPWLVGNKEVSMEKIISIDAGSQMTHVQATFSYGNEEEMDIVAGIVLREDKGEIINGTSNDYAGYWEPTYEDKGTLGLAIVKDSKIHKVFTEHGQLLSLLKATNKEAVSYYHGAAWDKAEEITSADSWKTYLLEFIEKRNNPLKITIK